MCVVCDWCSSCLEGCDQQQQFNKGLLSARPGPCPLQSFPHWITAAQRSAGTWITQLVWDPGPAPGMGSAYSPLPAWKIPPLDVHMSCSLTSFRSLLKFLPYQSPPLTTLYKIATLPPPPTSPASLLSKALITIWQSYLLAYLCFVLLFPLDYKPHVGKGFIHFAHCFITGVSVVPGLINMH